MNQNAEQFLSTEDFVLYVEEDADQAAAESIADELQINRIQKSSAGSLPTRCLLMDAEGLSLVEGTHTLRGDFARFLPRLVPNNLNHELLVKAARLRGAQGPLSAVDATAGLGEDAFLLAAAGFQVWLYERNPVIAALLQDALRRGMKNPELAPVLGRMHFHRGFRTGKRAASSEKNFRCSISWKIPARKKRSCLLRLFPVIPGGL